MNAKDSLGDRIKGDYENRTKTFLPRRTFTLIRCDGRAFHTYTKDCKRPYDAGLMADMNATAVALCEQLTGARFAYVQSDEIQILLTDFDQNTTEAFFDGSVQKICSISASVATAKFNHMRLKRIMMDAHSSEEAETAAHSCEKFAHFDARVWTIPQRIEVYNAFLWRQQDATRNAIQMAAQAQFSHKELQGVGCNQLQEKLFQERSINFNDYPDGFKRGRMIVREAYEVPMDEYVQKYGNKLDIGDGRTLTINGSHPAGFVKRNRWVAKSPPIFSQDREWLLSMIPDPNAVSFADRMPDVLPSQEIV